MAEPYYEDDWVTIYNGDSVEVLEGFSGVFDGVVTDPPFSSGARTDARKAARGAMTRGKKWSSDWFTQDNLSTVGFLMLTRLILSRALTACKDDATAQVFIDWRMAPNLYGILESTGWVVKNMVVWDKVHFGMGNNYRNQHELVYYAEKGKPEFQTHSVGNVISSKRIKAELHPTQKPVDFLQTLIESAIPPGGTVVDPFGGSFATAEAARRCGRKAVVSEISEQFCEAGAQRLSALLV